MYPVRWFGCSRVVQMFQKSLSNLIILRARKVPQSKLCTGDPQLLGTTIQNLSHHSDQMSGTAPRNSILKDVFIVCCIHRWFQFGWVGSPELANSIAMSVVPLPYLLVVNSTTRHHHIPEDDPSQLTPEAVTIFLEQIHNQSAPVSHAV